MHSPVTIACVLYQGEDVPAHSLGIFTPEWVDRLYRGFKRHSTRPFRFVCFVDRDDYQFAEAVETRKLLLPYRNMLSLLEPFREDFGRVVFVGLDTVVVGNVDALLDYAGPFAMLTDPYVPERPCSGVTAFPYRPDIWADIEARHAAILHESTVDLPGFGVPSDMIYLARYPTERIDHYVSGIYSYKAHIKGRPFPKDARIIYFHGKDKPHEIDEPWCREHWGEPPLRPVTYVETLNNSRENMLANVRGAIARDLPWFTASPEHKRAMIVVGGGPSLVDTLPNLRLRYNTNRGDIFALNGAHDWLIERRIFPKYHLMLDSRPENVGFVRKPHPSVKYLVGAQSPPEVFDALKGHDVTLWLTDMDGVYDLVKDVQDKPVILVGGGATVGMKSMYLGYLMGYRNFHFYGLDSCYRKEANHAYPQPMNDAESRMEVVAAGRKFTCAPWMAKQAMEFQRQARELMALGCQITVHGDGLIAHIMDQWNQEANRAAG